MAENLTQATRGNKYQHTINIVTDDLPPIISRIKMLQDGNKGKRVFQQSGMVTVTAHAKDPNGSALTYAWSSNTLIDIDTDGKVETFEFDPAQVATGEHNVILRVSDGTHTVERKKRIQINAGVLAKPDDNENGIPDDLEDASLSNNQLSMDGDNPIETNSGLNFELGNFAQHGNNPNNCQVSEDNIRQFLTDNDYAAYQADIAHTPTLILDYVISDLEEIGGTAQVVFSVSACLCGTFPSVAALACLFSCHLYRICCL